MRLNRVAIAAACAVIFGVIGALAGEFIAGKGSRFMHVFPPALVGAVVGWSASAPKSKTPKDPAAP